MIILKNILYIIIIFAAVAFIELAFTLCTTIKESDLYGTYVATYFYTFDGKEVLVLKPNGEYYQEVTVPIDANSKTAVNTNRWRYDPKTRSLLIEHMLVVANGFGMLNNDYNTPSPGLSVMPVSKFFPWSPIQIETNPDWGYRYVKE